MPKGNADRTNNPWKKKVSFSSTALKIRKNAERLAKDNRSTIGGVEKTNLDGSPAGMSPKGDRETRKVDPEEAVKKTHKYR